MACAVDEYFTNIACSFNKTNNKARYKILKQTKFERNTLNAK